MDDANAVRISENIQRYHLPHGFIAETIFNQDDKSIDTVVGYGDCAIWTGVYLAAETFRFAVTKRESGTGTGDARAWSYLQGALKSIHDLATVAPSGFLARAMFPDSSPFKERLIHDEKHSGLFKVMRGKELWYWVGHHTRDQYSGALFGLATAYDLSDDAGVRQTCCETITRLVDALIANNWTMSNPAPVKRFLETFGVRPDHLLAVLQLAKHVNPKRFADCYEANRRILSPLAGIPQWTDFFHLRDRQYSMMNLGYLYFYQLIHYEEQPGLRKRYQRYYSTLREKTGGHYNAHFNMIDCALTGRHDDRDRQTVALLESLLARGFRNKKVNVSGQYPNCGDDACEPVAVIDRPYEDFLWQRHPFSMVGGSDGLQESAGLDFILPYWMARWYGVIKP